MMTRPVRDWNAEQSMLLPLSMHDFVAADHVAHFVRDTVAEQLDLSAVWATYGGDRGHPPPLSPADDDGVAGCTPTTRASTPRGASPRRASSASTSWPTPAWSARTSARSATPASSGEDDDAAAAWIDPGAGLEELEALLGPPAGELIEAYPVSLRVNKPENDDPGGVEQMGESRVNAVR
jgi:hypothetical protein